jgi:carbon storage regulator
MLILTRKLGENIQIGDSITVSVLGIKGSHVKLGITASRDTQVLREELAKKIKEMNVLASKAEEHELGMIARSWTENRIKVEGGCEDQD